MNFQDSIKIRSLAKYNILISFHVLEKAPPEFIEQNIKQRLVAGLGELARAKATIRTTDNVEEELRHVSANVYILSIEEMQAYRHSIIQETLDQLSGIAGANKPAPEEKNDE